jgi:L-ascorbate metabolism protein UlaG (beta-lactamase superfamily)
MDSIDFDSWDEKKDKTTPLTNEFDRKSFEHFNDQIEQARKICNQYVLNSEIKEEVIKKIFIDLFNAKLDRLDARIAFERNDIINNFIESAKTLQSALNCIDLNYLQKSSIGERKKDFDLLLILLYNDLSISYSGLRNSSLSRGYAEQSIELIRDNEGYSIFSKMVEPTDVNYEEISKISFISGGLFDLYTYALFCRGVAEFRSSLKDEAEKTFKQIIEFADKTHRWNSDYVSTCINLAELLIDLSRGKEAIQMLDRVNKVDSKDSRDIRLANCILQKTSALIDQSLYGEARITLDEFFKRVGSRDESFAEPFLTGQIYYGRSFLEEARNVVKNREFNLSEAERELKNALERSEKRDQKNLIQKAAKYLGEVHKETEEIDDALDYYSISISEGEIKKFEDLLNQWKIPLNRCEDIYLLNNFSEICLKKSTHEDGSFNDVTLGLCHDLSIKLRNECKEKENQLDLSEKAQRRLLEIELIRGNSKDIHPETLDDETTFSKNFDKLVVPEVVPDIGDVKNTVPVKTKKLQFCNQLLSGALFFDRMNSNENTFDDALYSRIEFGNSNHNNKNEKPHVAELVVLRRWNSFSPSLSKRYAISLGGGYLLRIRKPVNKLDIYEDPWFNVVIDPGFNFLLNFHSENFKVQDIDAVIVTHSHSDHCAELSGIMDLMHQINKRRKKKGKEENKIKKRVYLLLSKGAYKKFSPYIPDWKEQLKDVVLLEDKTTWTAKDQEFEIEAIQTAHADLGGVRAIGILVNVKQNGGIVIGFTGDTPWRKYIQEKFNNCDVLCLHTGGIKKWEIGYDENDEELSEKDRHKKIKENTRQSNHLLYFGSLDIIEKCKKPEALVIVGEFGEELKYGLRTDLVEKLIPECGKPLCIPADAGLYLKITDEKEKKIRCDFCVRFVTPDKIRIFSYGIVDSLHYICNACHLTLNESQKRTVVESALTRH